MKIYLDVLAAILRIVSSAWKQTTGVEATQSRLPVVSISEESNQWNQIALQYAEDRRSLHGRLPRYVGRTADAGSGKAETDLASLTESTDEWNKTALAYARKRRLGMSSK